MLGSEADLPMGIQSVDDLNGESKMKNLYANVSPRTTQGVADTLSSQDSAITGKVGVASILNYNLLSLNYDQSHGFHVSEVGCARYVTISSTFDC